MTFTYLKECAVVGLLRSSLHVFDGCDRHDIGKVNEALAGRVFSAVVVAQLEVQDTYYCLPVSVRRLNNTSTSFIYWTGPFPGVKIPIEACALGRCMLS